ncbi:ABC transporter ATP-binding protein [Lysobacter xinjiangensis]|uniref:ABC transporter ATP-binding protein n=1 Tax=Cognatilysobacter xinjiangensis TaxID=546892 RepID=A0ABQ3C715_9GAMM|nr:ABC transporter ATP-binding protein [Lysobacter xinjiangensis]GGZ70788.1 ABC transporter ATP-binding protein [Lysobacter xinjiangensis]
MSDSLNPTPARDAIAIRVADVSKTYRMWATPSSRLLVPLMLRSAGVMGRIFPAAGQRLAARGHARMHTHTALSDISFELKRGEALGIIGLNGSGKSTLLQIIAGVLPPSQGAVEIHGRVAALLELGSGFNPELSGRENVFINGAILGLDRARIQAVLDDIVAFADIGDYIDEPVKTYSSGMALRLAFAVQVHTEPDILIVDEALAVGDAAFQAKAMARIDEILSRGTTLLFVGHDLNAVKAFCHRAMLLESGRIALSGLPDEVITEYLHRTHRRALEAKLRPGAGAAVARLDDGYGLDTACVVGAAINDVDHATVGYGQTLEVRLDVRLGPDVEHPGVIFDILDAKGLQLTGRRIMLPRVASLMMLQVRIEFDALFQQGIYRIRSRVIDAPELDRTTVLSRQEGRLSFEVVDDSRSLFTGIFPVPMQVHF